MFIDRELGSLFCDLKSCVELPCCPYVEVSEQHSKRVKVEGMESLETQATKRTRYHFHLRCLVQMKGREGSGKVRLQRGRHTRGRTGHHYESW